MVGGFRNRGRGHLRRRDRESRNHQARKNAAARVNHNGKGSIGGRKMRLLGALLFATLVTGCYVGGWRGGRPGYYSSPGYYGNSYYSNNPYRGYGAYPQPGLFGGYPPAHEAWAASTRGRTSYGSVEHHGGASRGYTVGGGGHGGGGGGHGGGDGHGH